VFSLFWNTFEVMFEVFMAVTMKNSVFCDITLFGSCKNWSSSETSALTIDTQRKIPEYGILQVWSRLMKSTRCLSVCLCIPLNVRMHILTFMDIRVYVSKQSVLLSRLGTSLFNDAISKLGSCSCTYGSFENSIILMIIYKTVLVFYSRNFLVLT
jgi:hypothetical protein